MPKKLLSSRAVSIVAVLVCGLILLSCKEVGPEDTPTADPNPTPTGTPADIVFVVDESGTMIDVIDSLSGLAGALETALEDAEITETQYALIGFGGTSGNVNRTGGWVDADDLETAISALGAAGGDGTEDGYDAITYAFETLTFRDEAPHAIILITDEDRDIVDSTVSLSSVKLLFDEAFSFHAIVNVSYSSAGTDTIFGADYDYTAFLSDNAGGYTAQVGSFSIIENATNVRSDYITNFAWDSDIGGTAWDITLLDEEATADTFGEVFSGVLVPYFQ